MTAVKGVWPARLRKV